MNKKLENNLCDYFCRKIKDGFLFACSTEKHAYSLLSIVEENFDKIFQIRNPWGTLSEKNKEYFKNFYNKFHIYKLEEKTGIFFLDKQTFEEYFEDITICHILFGTTI